MAKAHFITNLHLSIEYEMSNCKQQLFRTIKLITLVLVSCNVVFGQLKTKTREVSNELDQLLDELPAPEAFAKDSLLIEEMNQKALFQSNQSLDSALATLSLALTLSDQINNIDLKAVTYYNYGQVNEQHGEFADAESFYKKWYNIRSAQSIDKNRWGMMGMRDFYSRHLQIEKLTEIDDKWIDLIDNQYDNGVEAKYGYQASSYAVINNLVALGEVYQAEERFIHLVEKNQGVNDWVQSGNFYFQVHTKLVELGDVNTLKDWYQRWFKVLSEFNPNKNEAASILDIISSKIVWSYPELAIHLVDDLYKISTSIDGGQTTRHFMDSWIPKLNVGMVDANNRLRSKNEIVFFEQALKLNVNAASNPLLNGENELVESYLKSIKLAAEHLSGLSNYNNPDLVEFLNLKLEKATSKKFKKVLKRTIKAVS